MQYRVTQTIQGQMPLDDGFLPEPVVMTYYRGTDIGQALAALVNAALVNAATSPDDSKYVQVLSVRKIGRAHV